MENFDDEIIALFLSFCSKQDAEFLKISRDKRNPEDYARLISVSLALGFRHFSLKLYNEVELSNCLDKVFSIIIKAKENGMEKKWILDFLKDMPTNKLTSLKNSKDNINNYFFD